MVFEIFGMLINRQVLKLKIAYLVSLASKVEDLQLAMLTNGRSLFKKLDSLLSKLTFLIFIVYAEVAFKNKISLTCTSVTNALLGDVFRLVSMVSLHIFVLVNDRISFYRRV